MPGLTSTLKCSTFFWLITLVSYYKTGHPITGTTFKGLGSV